MSALQGDRTAACPGMGEEQTKRQAPNNSATTNADAAHSVKVFSKGDCRRQPPVGHHCCEVHRIRAAPRAARAARGAGGAGCRDIGGGDLRDNEAEHPDDVRMPQARQRVGLVQQLGDSVLGVGGPMGRAGGSQGLVGRGCGARRRVSWADGVPARSATLAGLHSVWVCMRQPNTSTQRIHTCVRLTFETEPMSPSGASSWGLRHLTATSVECQRARYTSPKPPGGYVLARQRTAVCEARAGSRPGACGAGCNESACPGRAIAGRGVRCAHPRGVACKQAWRLGAYGTACMRVVRT